MEYYRRISLKIGYLRRLRGMTQEQFAERLGKHVTFISAIEAPRCNRTVSLDTLFDMAKVLGVDPSVFFEKD